VKRKILFIIIFNTFYFQTFFGQSITEIKSFADTQNDTGNYRLALKEYQRVYLFDKNHQFNDIFIKIADLFYQKKEYFKSVKYYNLAWGSEKNDSIKNEIVFRKALCFLNNKDYYGALNELYDLNVGDSEYFTKKEILFEAICQYGLEKYDNAANLFLKLVDESGRKELIDAFTDFKRRNKKYSPNRIETMSRFLPGLGQIYLGKWKNGINSFVLIAAVIYYSVYTAVTYTFLDGALVLSSWFNRYYSGGYGKARELANEKLKKDKSIFYTKLLTIIEKHVRK